MVESLRFKAACVQASSTFHDVDAGVDKAITLIEEAAATGAKVIAFPECWIPGYPWWAWLDSPAWGMQFVQKQFENCMTADGPHAERLTEAAQKNDIYVVMGYSERENGTLYISQMHIDPWAGERFTRRKLKATHVERTIFGEGGGEDFIVRDTEIGRLGSLCCWEHINPLNKFAMYAQNEQIHIASWPSFSIYLGAAFALGPELNSALSQVYAAEGQCFVLAACGLISPEMQDIICDTPEKKELLRLGGGHAMIFGPDGKPMCDPIPHDQEGILYADIDYGAIALAKAAGDPAGHYARPDVFRLMFNKGDRKNVVSFESGFRLTGSRDMTEEVPSSAMADEYPDAAE